MSAPRTSTMIMTTAGQNQTSYESMEQLGSKIDDLCANGGGLNIEQVIAIGNSNNVRKKVARRRWAILAKALKHPTISEPSSPTDEYSVRRISSLTLLRTQQLDDVHVRTTDSDLLAAAKSRAWYKYALDVGDDELHVTIGHRLRTFSAEDLMGFNNTGNVCVWPSEEALAYYLAANLHLLAGRSVLELGGGMSCLAGLMAAKYGRARAVHLTDGNRASVENVQVSLACNELACPTSCAVFKWGNDAASPEAGGSCPYDVVLCADCLFFDDARDALIVTLWACLAPQGIALIMAPKRGATLANFIAQCRSKGFCCNEVLKYDRTVWEKHLSLLANCDYDDNIHYPILIELTKA